jgi:hypothetical protein
MNKEYQNHSVVLSSSNIVPGTKNSVLKYTFDSAMKFNNAQISLSTLNMYFSWFNISSSLNNNRFSYKWFDSSGDLSDAFEIVIKDGYYSVNDLNEYVQSMLVTRGHYLKQVSSGNHIYHIEFITNKVYYTIELNVYAMMTSDAAGANYVRGSTDWAYPAEYTTVQVILNSTNKFSSLIGFENKTYPEVSDANNHAFASTVSPIMEPISTVLVLCSFATQGGYSNPDNIIYSFTNAGVGFGDMIEKNPVINNYVNIRDGVYSNFTIEFVDQNFQRIDIKDPSILVMMNFKIETNNI